MSEVAAVVCSPDSVANATVCSADPVNQYSYCSVESSFGGTWAGQNINWENVNMSWDFWAWGFGGSNCG